MTTFTSPTLTSDYQGLCNAIADTLNRQDLTTGIPNFVALANTRISRDLINMRHQASLMETVLELTSEWTALPSGFVSMYYVRLPATKVYLDYITPEEMKNLQAAGEPTGVTTYYTVINDGLMVYPAPTVSTPLDVDIWYYRSLTALNDTATTNWALLRYPDLFFYGSLVNSAPYLKADERVSMWEGAYKTIYNDIVVEASRGNAPQASLRAITKGF